MKISTLFVLTLCLHFSPTFAQPQTKYSGSDLDGMLRRLEGTSVAVNSMKSSHYQGQYVFLQYEIQCVEPCSQSWTQDDVVNWMEISRAGQSVWSRRHVLHWGQNDDSLDTFSGFIQLNRQFWSSGSNESFGFYHLLPGAYAAHYDHGITSPEITFSIEPVPDSLTNLWSVYCSLARQEQRVRVNGRLGVDSVLSAMSYFLEQSPGTVWRKEAFDKGIFIMSLAAHFVSYGGGDRQIRDRALLALIGEPDFPKRALAECILSTVPVNATKAETIEHLLHTTTQLGNEEVIIEGEKLAGEIAGESREADR